MAELVYCLCTKEKPIAEPKERVMDSEEQLAILKQGKEAWNCWRREHSQIIPSFEGLDLSEQDLSGFDLSATNFRKTTLCNAVFRGADLSSADLSAAKLSRADLSGTDLRVARLACTDLVSADLCRADMSGANLTGANLRRADLIEASLVRAKLSKANLSEANLSRANLKEASLLNANLQVSILLETHFEGADLTGCRVYGASAWGLSLDGAKQEHLVITSRSEPTITVDSLEVAQFIYLFLNNARIRSVFDSITSKVVLILGRFTSERKAVLDALRLVLPQHDYLPVLFDFDKPAARDTQETIYMLASMSRFIIADITDPRSIPQELVSIVPNLPSVPIQPLLMVGRQPWGMYDHISRYPWVLPVHPYDGIPNLLVALIEKLIGSAEAKLREVRPR